MARMLLVEEVERTDDTVRITGCCVSEKCDAEIMESFDAAMAAKRAGNENYAAAQEAYQRLVGKERVSVVLNCKDTALKPGDIFPYQ